MRARYLFWCLQNKKFNFLTIQIEFIYTFFNKMDTLLFFTPVLLYVLPLQYAQHSQVALHLPQMVP